VTLLSVRKFLVAVAGVAATAVTEGLVTGSVARWAGIAIAVVTAALVYLVPNAPAGSTATPSAVGPVPKRAA
jgi:hypothetical protein